ncbi:unnamed protein product [Didymodactylos carnosus]|uniref:Peptidase C19 ubiquitin carboxyl-terminal hydrolase domain-containing protein n=1 Tax=Didymodactylos carnosus TaxID=1234261 RepID=A0A814J8Y2_9BILA|nr:unnamed protein product [Didymodactylos carnosus]CAF1036116.1 unnamed protein product [Didymodactylos carnosus]CAF3541374.1 unnamed protein product [Didymodactylos carnosus]CAF3806696.1 unnamed protein product [Didymodactylos carnosus]
MGLIRQGEMSLQKDTPRLLTLGNRGSDCYVNAAYNMVLNTRTLIKFTDEIDRLLIHFHKSDQTQDVFTALRRLISFGRNKNADSLIKITTSDGDYRQEDQGFIMLIGHGNFKKIVDKNNVLDLREKTLKQFGPLPKLITSMNQRFDQSFNSITYPVTFITNKRQKYHFISAIVHMGTKNGGHYIAFIRRNKYVYILNDNTIDGRFHLDYLRQFLKHVHVQTITYEREDIGNDVRLFTYPDPLELNNHLTRVELVDYYAERKFVLYDDRFKRRPKTDPIAFTEINCPLGLKWRTIKGVFDLMGKRSSWDSNADKIFSSLGSVRRILGRPARCFNGDNARGIDEDEEAEVDVVRRREC